MWLSEYADELDVGSKGGVKDVLKVYCKDGGGVLSDGETVSGIIS